MKTTSDRTQVSSLRSDRRTCPVRRPGLWMPAVLVAATLLSGCSFTWGEGGIGDILFGGRKADEIVGQNDPNQNQAKPGVTAAPAAAEVEGSSLRKVAILPVAWTDGTNGQPCDLCPPSVTLKATDALSARLATGFIYEAVARHPRFLFPPHAAVEKTLDQTPGHSMRQAMATLSSGNRADYAIIAALVELRQRVGDNKNPESPAGVAMYAALVDAKTGETIWSDTFDDNESSRGVFLGTYDKVMNDRPIRWSTAQEYTEHAVDELIEDLVDELD
jgi:hypothetical protein